MFLLKDNTPYYLIIRTHVANDQSLNSKYEVPVFHPLQNGILLILVVNTFCTKREFSKYWVYSSIGVYNKINNPKTNNNV